MFLHRATPFSLRPFAAALAAAALAVLLLIPAARSNASSVIWNSPTPADHTKFAVKTGAQVTFTLTASTSTASVVHIEAVRAPKGISFNSSDGSAARATFAWTPEQAGDYELQFEASTVDASGARATAPTLNYTIHVTPTGGKTVKYPVRYTLATDKVAHWAAVLKPVLARTKPSASAHQIATLQTMTGDGTQNIVLVLDGIDVGENQTWYRVRLPILPNNSTGWVQARYLGDLYKVRTHLYIDRKHFTATLKRDGKTIFRSIVGVGRTYWPTPRGEFYVRSKLTNFNDPFYGPVAFGTSARSAVLTDWPGGGFVGVHGTNQPDILPGRVSHGCIRMRNGDILKLARLMPVGAPLTIT